MSEDRASQPWGHIHLGLEHMNKPASDIEKMEGIGWGYDPDKAKTEVNGNGRKALDQEELETLTYLNEGERLDCSLEKVLAGLSGDMVGLAYRADFMRSSVSVKGKGREGIIKILGTSTPKISVPTTLSKVREKLTGGKKERELEWENQPQG